MTNTVNLTFCLSDAAPEQPDLTCPIRRYWNSSLRSKPSRQVRRESCQSWYNFPPASSFFFWLSHQLSCNNSFGNACYTGDWISKRSNREGRYSTNFFTGNLRPAEKVPFGILSIDKWYPFYIPGSKICTSLNCNKYTVFLIWINPHIDVGLISTAV